MKLFAGFALFSAVTAGRRFRREEAETETETDKTHFRTLIFEERGTYYQAPAYQPAYQSDGGYTNVHDNHADPSYTATAFVPAGLNTHYSEQVHHMQTAGGYQQANGYSDNGSVANGETFGDVGEVNIHTAGSTYKEGTSAYNGQALDVQAASVVSNPLDHMVDQANPAYSNNGYGNGYNNGYNSSPGYSSGYNSGYNAPEPYSEPTYGGYEQERGKGDSKKKGGKPSKKDKKADKRREKENKKNKKKADKENKKNKKRQEKEGKKNKREGKKADKENKKNHKKAAKKAKKNSKQIARSMGMRPGTFNREAFLAAQG
ncbi:Oidioi.mRNA.OKI2018_I69.XSR.g16439.t1.cds [Oikopleura dioica]|uniref:Oidioi.mRNA.OKI2018_I69.XSR.g16439.t1.cds n=1 Tax=Oikopleura dioica TaxID=34765 RepID=A0ABN7SGL5_OIKDI|nr:Oidioi.mRNA.OKI2018_I69.XSR.g16439.t1.cds [Oikopleura dioica]